LLVVVSVLPLELPKNCAAQVSVPEPFKATLVAPAAWLNMPTIAMNAALRMFG